MSVFLSSFGLFLILFLGATGNFASPEDDDMELFGRSWDLQDLEDHIEMTKRAGINIGIFRDFGRFLKKARKQQFLLSQEEDQLMESKPTGRQFLKKTIPNIEIRNIQALLNSQGGLSYGRG